MEEALYPSLQLPGGFHVTTQTSDLTRQEARGYFKALTRVMPYRILLLMAWHEESISNSPEDDLRRLGHKVAEYISDERFVYYEDITLDDGKRKIELGPQPFLYDHAQYMAMDMGLFLAVMLLQLDHPDLDWYVKLTCGKRDIDRHHAVVSGPRERIFAPIGQSVGWAHAIVKGTHTANIWAEYFLAWVDMIEGREPRSLRNV